MRRLSTDKAVALDRRSEFRCITDDLLARLDRLDADDRRRFDAICLEIHAGIRRVLAHGWAEGKLLRHSFDRDEGGEG